MKTDIQKKFDKEFADKEITTDNWTEFADRENASIVDVLTKEEVRELIEMISDKSSGLTDEERLILCSLFHIPMSIELVGKKFGIQASGALKLVNKTTDKLKKRLRKAGITKDDL